MNILVTGANGQLGNEMRNVAGSLSHGFVFSDVNEVEGVQTLQLDITDIGAVRAMVSQYNIDAIVNCAAFNHVDAAEANGEMAQKLNAQAPENLAQVMKEVGGFLVHISSDYVFGGEPYNTPCTEDMKATPTGVYGLSKLNGEERVKGVGGNYVIIRTAWLYSEYGRNFCKTMMNLTATKPELKVVFDQVGTPTYALDLAKAIAVVLEDFSAEKGAAAERGVAEENPFEYSKRGIYHYSNEGVCSWYDFTKMIAHFNGTTECNVQPCHSSEFPSIVKRPPYSVLNKTKIKATFGVEVPYWVDSLKVCIENMKKQ